MTATSLRRADTSTPAVQIPSLTKTFGGNNALDGSVLNCSPTSSWRRRDKLVVRGTRDGRQFAEGTRGSAASSRPDSAGYAQIPLNPQRAVFGLIRAIGHQDH